MSRLLRRVAIRRARRPLVAAGGVALVLILALALAPAVPGAPPWPFRLVSVGRGSGGVSGHQIWAEAWWYGTPEGPGPYEGPPPGGEAVCSWHDLGPGIANLDGGLSEASLPLSFWSRPDSGGHPGIWGVNEWAEGLLAGSTPTDHFDLVACPNGSQVPASGGDVEANLPRAHPPQRAPLYLWLFFDTVPDPPGGALPGIVEQAFQETKLPSPGIGTSPFEVGGIADATVVNLATWLWVSPGNWHDYSATASAGGYVAYVWARPATVRWTATWDFPAPSDDPQGGTTFGPEVLDEVCDGPGSVYDPAVPGEHTGCSFDFTQSSFGTYQELRAAVTWDVFWALADAAGVVGGEGSLGTVVTAGRRALRVMQVESLIWSG